MQVPQTQRNSLTDYADGGRSESIISDLQGIVYSTPFINIGKPRVLRI